MTEHRIDWHRHFHGSIPTAALDALLSNQAGDPEAAQLQRLSGSQLRPTGLDDFFERYANIENRARLARKMLGDEFDAIVINWIRAELASQSVQEAHLFFSASISFKETVGRAQRLIDAVLSSGGPRILLRLTFPRRRRHSLTLVERLVKSVARLDPQGIVVEGWDISDSDSAITISESVCLAGALCALRDDEQAAGGPRRTVTCHVGEHYLTWTLDDLAHYFSSLKNLGVDRLGHASVLFVCDEALRSACLAPSLVGTQTNRRVLARSLSDAGILFEICPTMFLSSQPLCSCCSSPWRKSGVDRSGFLVGTDSPALLGIDVVSEERLLWA